MSTGLGKGGDNTVHSAYTWESIGYAWLVFGNATNVSVNARSQ